MDTKKREQRVWLVNGHFHKQWREKEIKNLDNLDLSSSQKLILQMLIFNLNFIFESKVYTLKDYEKEKRKICMDSDLIDKDNIKIKVIGHLSKK